MKESERIREEVFAAAAALTAASVELDRVLGKQAAYRSARATFFGGVGLPAGFEQFTPEQAFRWLTASTPEEDEFWERRRSADFEAEHETYRRARSQLFNAEFEAGIARLKDADASGAEYAIAYIEADPWHFHSGYLKQKYARWLRRVALTDEHRERLRAAVLAAIQKGRREDLSEYVALGRRLDSPDLRRELEKLVATADEDTRYRAQRMLDACGLNDGPRR